MFSNIADRRCSNRCAGQVGVARASPPVSRCRGGQAATSPDWRWIAAKLQQKFGNRPRQSAVYEINKAASLRAATLSPTNQPRTGTLLDLTFLFLPRLNRHVAASLRANPFPKK